MVALYQYSFKELLLKLEYFKYLTRCTKRKIQCGAIKQLLNGMCICMSDNPLAKACGLSFSSGAHTIQYLCYTLSRGVRLIKNFFLFYLKIFFTFTNSVDPDEMQHYAAFHLGLHCLRKYSFWGFLNTKG